MFLLLFFSSLEVFVFVFAFVLVCQIHLGLLYALLVSHVWLGAFGGPMVMNRGCYLKRGLLRPSRRTQSPGHEMDSEFIALFSAFPSGLLS